MLPLCVSQYFYVVAGGRKLFWIFSDLRFFIDLTPWLHAVYGVLPIYTIITQQSQPAGVKCKINEFSTEQRMNFLPLAANLHATLSFSDC